MTQKKKKTVRQPGPAKTEQVPQQADRRLAELTNQSVELLEQLADSRQALAAAQKEQSLWQHRYHRLHEVLDDARRRVRSNRSQNLLLPEGNARLQDVEIVLWSPASSAKGWQNISTGDLPVTLLMPSTAKESADWQGARLRVQKADEVFPAQLWNLGMASSNAPHVLFLAAGCKIPSAEKLADIPAYAADEVALAQPALQDAAGNLSLGLQEQQDLQMARMAMAASGKTLPQLDFVAPEAFLLSRAAYEELGPFDENLRGTAALLEYCLRAQSNEHHLIGLPDLQIQCEPLLDLSTENSESDRMVVLAQHRPGEVALAMSRCQSFWDLSPSELRQWLGTVYQRLPNAAQWPEAVEVLVQESVAIAAHTLSGPALQQNLKKMEGILSQIEELPCQEESPHLSELHRQIRSVLRDGQNEPNKGGMLMRLQQFQVRLKLEREAKGELFRLLQSAQEHLQELNSQSKALVNQGQDLKNQLQQRDEQTGELQTQMHAASKEIKNLRDQLTQTQAAHLQDNKAHEAEFARMYEQLEPLRVELERVRCLSEAATQLHQSENLSASEKIILMRQDYQTVLGMICESLLAPTDMVPEQIVARIRDLESTLADRNRWIASLLAELSNRRLKLGKRELREHELTFLAEQKQEQENKQLP